MEKEDRYVAIENLLKILNDPPVVIDIGARWGFQEHWKRLGSFVRLIGVDADEQEVQSLNNANQGKEFIPKVLGSKNDYGEFHITQDPACGSLYPPDEKLIRSRPSMQVTNLISTEKVEITTLDNWAQTKHIPKVDFIKLDVQGAELDVLMGAEKTLQTVRMLEVEVQFNPLYQGVPLFGDVDSFLRKRGFSLWRIKNLCHYGMSEYSLSLITDETIKYDYFTKRFKGRNGQLYWGDAFYVREEIAYNGSRSWKTALQDACISGILGFEDLYISSIRNSLLTCPITIKEEIRKSFLPSDATLAEIEADQTHFDSNQPRELGIGLEDEYIELEQIKSLLDALQIERDQALKQLDAFYHSRSFKFVSILQSVYGFFSKPNKNRHLA
jgi:FkbM family methyltransferase